MLSAALCLCRARRPRGCLSEAVVAITRASFLLYSNLAADARLPGYCSHVQVTPSPRLGGFSRLPASATGSAVAELCRKGGGGPTGSRTGSPSRCTSTCVHARTGSVGSPFLASRGDQGRTEVGLTIRRPMSPGSLTRSWMATAAVAVEGGPCCSTPLEAAEVWGHGQRRRVVELLG